MHARPEPLLRLARLSAFDLPLADLPETPTPEQMSGWLHAQELLRWQSQVLPRRRREWLAGRLCAKAALQSLLPAPPPAPQMLIDSDALARPRLAGSALHLSITHSRRRAIAVAGTYPLGIDTETHAALGALSLEALLEPAEVALTARHFDCPEAAARTLLWCLKEARFKCQGQGSFVGLARNWRLRAWQVQGQPRWQPDCDWSAAPPGCRWWVRLHLDADEAWVLVYADGPQANNIIIDEGEQACVPTA